MLISNLKCKNISALSVADCFADCFATDLPLFTYTGHGYSNNSRNATMAGVVVFIHNYIQFTYMLLVFPAKVND